jgi:hypothetical protein
VSTGFSRLVPIRPSHPSNQARGIATIRSSKDLAGTAVADLSASFARLPAGSENITGWVPGRQIGPRPLANAQLSTEPGQTKCCETPSEPPQKDPNGQQEERQLRAPWQPMEEELRDGYRLREEMEEASRRSGARGAGEGTEQEKARSRRRGGGRERARREDKGEEWSWEKREAGTPAPAAHQTSQEAAASGASG